MICSFESGLNFKGSLGIVNERKYGLHFYDKVHIKLESVNTTNTMKKRALGWSIVRKPLSEEATTIFHWSVR